MRNFTFHYFRCDTRWSIENREWYRSFVLWGGVLSNPMSEWTLWKTRCSSKSDIWLHTRRWPQQSNHYSSSWRKGSSMAAAWPAWRVRKYCNVQRDCADSKKIKTKVLRRKIELGFRFDFCKWRGRQDSDQGKSLRAQERTHKQLYLRLMAGLRVEPMHDHCGGRWLTPFHPLWTQ